MDDLNSTCPFIQFTRELLTKNELSESVHHLQHHSGFNINIILYLVWLAKAGYGRLSKRNIKLLQSQVALWDQRIIAELKYTHALLSDHLDPVAVQIKNELQEEIAKAHLIEQHMLHETQIKKQILRRSSQQKLVDACVNIIRYCELKNDLLVEEDKIAFNKLFSAIFDKMDRDEIEKQISLAFSRLNLHPDYPVQMEIMLPG
ncbi:MAG: hypothetical protein A3C44_03570 [Gammaproteobacteria bacterium RIFCSPHIGHO2_02_FULL_39_13]|nr:MAG: hypothetical protein A3C44_03570 [Gammaproteobacteria bacterium RIFCSPHIGHO2_02_FULL_39_13]